jgi:uracil-DNA glycosylase family 4
VFSPRPPACRGCPLDDHPRTQGFVPPTGPVSAPILFLGEAPGEVEVQQGQPFTGPAGSLLNRLIARNHWERGQFRIANTICCRPVNNWLDGAPWQWGAIQHCAVHRDPVLQEGHKVIVALGMVAFKTLTGLAGKGIRMEDIHGCVFPTEHGLCIPTFHPSHLQRGAMNLFGTVSWDLQTAMRVTQDGWQQEPVSLVIDPPVDWFTAWVEQVEAAVAQDPASTWLSEDIETADKSSGQDEGALGREDRSYTITHVNFAVRGDEAVTVPYSGPFVPLIDRLVRLSCVHLLWNKAYDDERLAAAGHTLGGDRFDMMWAAHHLQSDLPRGLAFWAAFYDSWGAWKHLAKTDFGTYRACDGFKTWKAGVGIASDLDRQGLWEVFLQHTHQLYTRALKPAQDVGVLVDRTRLDTFIADLETKEQRLLAEMQPHIPEAILPLSPKGGLVHAPKDLASSPVRYVTRDVPALVVTCRSCGATPVTRTHRCPAPLLGDTSPLALAPRLDQTEQIVTRWFRVGTFSPDSPTQITRYAQSKGHTLGRGKSGKSSTDRDTLQKLARDTKDPLYSLILKGRSVRKIKSTYGEGTRKLLDTNGRVHPVPTFKPSTHRLSYVSPNITNVVADKDATDTIAAGFRTCIIASPGCRLLEVDYSAIEARLVGYFAGDPEFIRLSGLGVHGALASLILNRPYDPTASDADLSAQFKAIKRTEFVTYDRAKRCLYADLYGQTEMGMVLTFGESFPTLKIAKQYKRVLHEMAPKVPAWQMATMERAHRQNYLGGRDDHPYSYRHWYFAVLDFRPIPYSVYLKRQKKREPVTENGGRYYAIARGPDAKRAISFYPQSTASGILKNALLALFTPDSPDYIGDLYFGKTPLRAPIHDSLLLELPVRVWDRALERVYRAMLRPIKELPLVWIPVEERTRLGLGAFLSIGVEGKAGQDWSRMTVLPSPTLQELGVSADGVYQAPDMGMGYGEDHEDSDLTEALATTA